MDIVVADALAFSLPSSSFDVALTNPPFGTKKNAGESASHEQYSFRTRSGIDMQFVKAALRLVKVCVITVGVSWVRSMTTVSHTQEGGRVYSLHKSSTRSFIFKKGAEFGADVRAVAQMRCGFPVCAFPVLPSCV